MMAGLDQPVDRADILALEPEPHAVLSERDATRHFSPSPT